MVTLIWSQTLSGDGHLRLTPLYAKYHNGVPERQAIWKPTLRSLL